MCGACDHRKRGELKSVQSETVSTGRDGRRRGGGASACELMSAAAAAENRV